MTQIDYKKVKCPKCGKSYFRVKEDTDFNISFFVFTKKPDPIYKDGELQNPTEADPIEKYCACLECGCNFSVNIRGDEYTIIDEDKLREEREKVLADYRKRCEEKKTDSEESLVIIGGPAVVSDGTATIKVSSEEAQPLAVTEKPMQYETIDIGALIKKLEALSERLDELEKKNG